VAVTASDASVISWLSSLPVLLLLLLLPVALRSIIESWPLFQFLDPYTVCRAPWDGDQPDARLLPTYKTKQSPWPESASELFRPRDRRLSAKLVPTFADRGCHVVSVKDRYGRILGFLDRSRYFFFQVAPQLYPRV
jgi:hypothetical protein